MTITDDRDSLGRYRLLRQLDTGGMGAVWSAEHRASATPVAIKLLAKSIGETETGVQRFLREARGVASLRGENVVQIFDYGVHGQVPFIVMELLAGESLAERLKRVGQLTPRDTELVVLHVGRALGNAHQAGIVHGDLRPANIFVTALAGGELCKLLDFGIAKGGVVVNPRSARNAALPPFYVSPEQAEGNRHVDHRTDIWSLGVIAFECLVGRPPFSASSLGGLMLAICTRPLPVPSQCARVPLGFDAWFARACARDPEHRFQSARDAAEGLSRAFRGSFESLPASAAPTPVRVAVNPRASALTRRIERPLKGPFPPPPAGGAAQRGLGRRERWAVGALALATLLVVYLLLAPSLRGSLEVVTWTAAATEPDDVEVIVDGDLHCSSTQCLFDHLSRGLHEVQVKAPGFLPVARHTVEVAGGDNVVHQVQLLPLPPAPGTPGADAVQQQTYALAPAAAGEVAPGAAPPVRLTAPSGLDAAAVQQTLQRYAARLREQCYNPALAARAPGTAHVELSVRVQPSGKVATADATASASNAELGLCIESSVLAWVFPSAPAPTSVVIPLDLAAP